MVQWLRLHLPIQGAQVRSLVGEVPHAVGCGQKKNVKKKKKVR